MARTAVGASERARGPRFVTSIFINRALISTLTTDRHVPRSPEAADDPGGRCYSRRRGPERPGAKRTAPRARAPCFLRFAARLPRRLRLPGHPWKARWFQGPEPPAAPGAHGCRHVAQALGFRLRCGGEGRGARRDARTGTGQEPVPGSQAEEQAEGVRAWTLRLQPGARVGHAGGVPRTRSCASGTWFLPGPSPFHALAPALLSGLLELLREAGRGWALAPLLQGHLSEPSAGCPGAQPRVTHV